MIIGSLLFALVGVSMTTEIIYRTTDFTIYSLADIRGVSKIGGFGESFFGIEQLLSLKSSASSFTAFTGPNAVEALKNHSADAIVGSYGSLMHYKLKIDEEAAEATKEAKAKADNSPWYISEEYADTNTMYITGDTVSTDLMYSYYIVYRPSHFTAGDIPKRNFAAKLQTAIEGARSQTSTAEAVNFPFGERIKKPAELLASMNLLYPLLAVSATILFLYFIIQVIGNLNANYNTSDNRMKKKEGSLRQALSSRHPNHGAKIGGSRPPIHGAKMGGRQNFNSHRNHEANQIPVEDTTLDSSECESPDLSPDSTNTREEKVSRPSPRANTLAGKQWSAMRASVNKGLAAENDGVHLHSPVNTPKSLRRKVHDPENEGSREGGESPSSVMMTPQQKKTAVEVVV
jgi:hypothetical protein